MKQVMHQVPMHCTYITTEAMTTAHVQVFMQCIFKLQASTVASQLFITDFPLVHNLCKFGTVYVVCGIHGFSSDECQYIILGA